jgi:glycosyltransferase involved in cell wall biosynthesis
VAGAEGELVRAATRVLAVSEHDAQRLADLYGRDVASMELAPNGVSLPDDPWLEAPRRAGLKASLGFDGHPVALFVGADHGPNHEAVALIVDVARNLPHWSFWVAGTICNCRSLKGAPKNVYSLGLVSEPELTALLRAADAGLNPMLRGSGSNLKMLDYAAHGVLALSTDVGARGLGFTPDTHYVAFAPERLAPSLVALETDLPSPRLAMRIAARKLVEERFSWRMIADRIAMVAGLG